VWHLWIRVWEGVALVKQDLVKVWHLWTGV
jgi:hypothetical protein